MKNPYPGRIPRVLCVLTTLPDAGAARRLAAAILDSGTAACATLCPGWESHYVWKNKRQKAREVGLLCKTTAQARKDLFGVIRQHHPYEVPEILAWVLSAVDPDYARWVGKQVGKGNRLSVQKLKSN
ncbi:MAG: divalent-cation tolerance protein CutA [Candidatus Methylacidiphilales bacterium]|nr:divalent-cation tolerance protein CutA [Candidatus Methylacidiphilales bacterium]